jgi:UDP-N-acetylmuramyl pentapeptide phosphotransferase/UDP-N-acetylglucosamine-1-phosphate transferase
MQPNHNSIPIYLLACATTTFSIGLLEDLTKKVSIMMRLLVTSISAGVLIYLLQIQIDTFGLPILDFIFYIPCFSFVLSIVAITGLANAYNIVDGFNGLSSMVGMLTLLGIAIVGYILADIQISFLALIMLFSILGFFVWNYPKGKIFLGDGGAYIIGFWIAALTLLLVSRHKQISPWFGLVINAYPVMETLFTIYRRKIHQNKSIGHPDGLHMHSLIYRRILFKRFDELTSNI